MSPYQLKRNLNTILLVCALFVVVMGVLVTQSEKVFNDGRPGIKVFTQYQASKAKSALGLDRFSSWGDQVGTMGVLKEENISSVESLLKDWRSVSLGDRTYQPKRILLLKLAEYQLANQEYEALLSLTTQWLQKDERDVTAMAYQAKALKQFDATYREGVCGLIEGVRRFPLNPQFAKFSGHLSEADWALQCPVNEPSEG